jgi:hypothetical protein
MITSRNKEHAPAYFALLAALIVLGLSGCAQKHENILSLNENYNSFRTQYGYGNFTGINLKASLYSSTKGKGHRTTIQIWGDKNSPLRLDVRAGIGAFLAHIRQDSTGLHAYYPDDETTYIHSDPVKGAQMLGLPLPFDIINLAGVMSGCFPGLIPESYDSGEQQIISGFFVYNFNSGKISSITTTSDGRPVSITGRDNNGWELKFSSFEEAEGKEIPDTLSLVTGDGDKAVLRIKSREFKISPWPDEALELRVPGDTDIIRLDRNTYVRVPARDND